MTDGSPVKLVEEAPAGSGEPTNLAPEPGGTSLHPTASPGLAGRVVKNVAAIMGGRGLSLMFSAGANVLLARLLGSERLGQFGAIYAYLALFGWLATFGFEPVLVREISRERRGAASLVHTAVVLSLFLSLGTVAVALFLAPRAGYAGYLWTLLALAAVEYALTPLRLPAVIFQVDLRQWYGATINVVRQGAWLAIISVLWVLKAPLLYVVAGRVASALLESLLLWIYGRRLLQQAGRFLRERAGMIFSHSFPLAFTSLLVTIYLRIDQVMLHKMASDYSLGQYVAAVRVSELFEALPAASMVTLAPIWAVSVADPEKFSGYVDRAFRYLMIVASALCVVLTVGARLVVRVLYGRQFLPAAPLLAVLIWSEIAVFFSAVVVNVLIAGNKQRLLPIPTIFGAAINIGLNLFWIPRYGAAGAAWATLVSYTLAWMVCLLFFKQTRSVAWRGILFAVPIAALALLSVGCAAILPVAEVLKVLAACVIFGVGIWVAGFIRKSELQNGFRILREHLGSSLIIVGGEEV